MIVQIQRQKRADIEPENQVFVQTLRQQHRVQRVKSLHDDHGLLGKPQLVAMPFPAAGFEIKGGQLHFLAPQQRIEVPTEQFRLDGVDML